MKNLLVLLCLVCFCGFAVSEESAYTTTGDSLAFTSTSPMASETGDREFPVYSFGLRFGLGYAATFQDFYFDQWGEYDGIEAEVMGSDVDWGFTAPNLAFTCEIKFGMPIPFEYFSVGVALDYNIVPIDGMEFAMEGSAKITASQDDVTDVHTLALIPFLEFRIPIAVGNTWIAPYARFGVGLSINIHDNDDLIDIDTASLNVLGSIGVEYFITDNISIFFEPRFHYNRPNMKFMPFSDTAKFHGEVDLSNLSLLLGVTMYFGTGKTF